MSITLRGESARLKVGYLPAVELRDVVGSTPSEAMTGDRWRLTGTIVKKDESLVHHTVFDLELDLLGSTAHWTWDGVHAFVGDRMVTVECRGEPRIT